MTPLNMVNVFSEKIVFLFFGGGVSVGDTKCLRIMLLRIVISEIYQKVLDIVLFNVEESTKD